MTDSLVKISDLSVDFAVRDGSFRAVDGVSFDLNKNETFEPRTGYCQIYKTK